MIYITHLGDAALLIPASALLIAYLAYRRFFDHARLWLATLALCGFLTLALKAILFACGPGLSTFALRSPSCHTSLSPSVDNTRATQLSTRCLHLDRDQSPLVR